MSAATAVIVAGICCVVASLAMLCRDLMIGVLISKLAAKASAEQKFAICERLAMALDSDGHRSAPGVGDRQEGERSVAGDLRSHRRRASIGFGRMAANPWYRAAPQRYQHGIKKP